VNTEVFSIENIDKIRWNRMAKFKSSIWQTFEWAMLNKTVNNEPLFIVVENNEEWLGGWMFFYNHIKILPSFLSGRIYIPSEPLIMDERRIQDVYKGLWYEIERMKPIELSWLNYVGSRFNNREVLMTQGFDRIVEYGSHILNLLKSEEELWRGVHGKHRNVIRKAERDSIIVEESEDVKAYHTLSAETYKRSNGRGPSYKGLQAAYDCLGPTGMCRLFTIKKDGNLISGAFMLVFGSRVTYWHGATCESPPTGASNLLQWEMIKKFKSEGYEWYDFGGASLNTDPESKSRGINRFKEQFGGSLEKFYGGYKIYSPIRIAILNKLISPIIKIFKTFMNS
jgi:hypothetical protein